MIIFFEIFAFSSYSSPKYYNDTLIQFDSDIFFTINNRKSFFITNLQFGEINKDL